VFASWRKEKEGMFLNTSSEFHFIKYRKINIIIKHPSFSVDDFVVYVYSLLQQEHYKQMSVLVLSALVGFLSFYASFWWSGISTYRQDMLRLDGRVNTLDQHVVESRRNISSVETELKKGIIDIKEEFVNMKHEVRKDIMDVKEEFVNMKHEVCKDIIDVKEEFVNMKHEVRKDIMDVKEEFVKIKDEVRKGFSDIKEEIARIKDEVHKGFSDIIE